MIGFEEGDFIKFKKNVIDDEMKSFPLVNLFAFSAHFNAKTYFSNSKPR